MLSWLGKQTDFKTNTINSVFRKANLGKIFFPTIVGDLGKNYHY